MTDQQCDSQQEMPMYKCYKKVWALKIKKILLPPEGNTFAGAILVFEEEGYADIQVSVEYMQKQNPAAGGYYVVYKDGYKSFSPAEAFEDGYMRIR